MKNVVGKPVTGNNFFGRTQELTELGEITQDEHVLLLAPRRVGKTSLLLALQSNVHRDRSATSVYVSVAAATNELQFVKIESLRFVLAGSIGLDNVTRRHRLTDTINDLRDWRLGPFTRDNADRFLGELAHAYQIKLGPDLRDAICDRAEWLIPYHLQVIFSALRKQCAGAAPTVTLLDRAIDTLISRKAYFTYWDERLHDAFGAPEDDLARTMLLTCARDARGATMTKLQRSLAHQLPDLRDRVTATSWIVDVLENDGYLVAEGGRYRFRSGLLRRYWLGHLS